MKIIKQIKLKEFITDLEDALTQDVSDLFLALPDAQDLELYIMCMEMVKGAKLVAFVSHINDTQYEGLNEVLKVYSPRKFKEQSGDADKHRACFEKWTYDEVVA